MPELVWRDQGQPGFGRNPGQLVAKGVDGESPALVGEQEVGELAR
jgi:hypothetical protein